MKRILNFICTASAVAFFSISASAQGPMGGGFPGGGFPGGGFPGMMGGNAGGSSKQDESYSKKLAKILTADQFQKWEAAQAEKKAAKAASAGSFQLPEGFQMLEGFTPGQMPQGMPAMPQGGMPAMPQGGMPGGFQMPEGFTPGQMPEGFQMPEAPELDRESELESMIGSLSAAEVKELAKLRTETMTQDLGLDEVQVKKVQKLNLNDIRIRQNAGGGMGGFGGGMMGGMPMGGGMPMF